MFLDWPKGIVQTPFGDLAITVTSAAHVALSTSLAHNKESSFKVKGNSYSVVSFHFNKVGNDWKAEQNGAKNFLRPYTETGKFDACMSDACYAKTLPEILKSLEKYFQDNPKVFIQAEIANAHNERDKLLGEIGELRSKLAEKEKLLMDNSKILNDNWLEYGKLVKVSL